MCVLVVVGVLLVFGGLLAATLICHIMLFILAVSSTIEELENGESSSKERSTS